MFKSKDITNKKFNMLTAVRIENKNKWNHEYWLFKCDCGAEKVIIKSDVVRGVVKSCGCLHKESVSTHKLSKTRIYNIYYGIKQRCYNKKQVSYRNYGSRGIKICKEWKDDFVNFYNWAINNGYNSELSLDRINSDKDYEPSNCRWVDRSIQSANRSITSRNKSGYIGIIWNKQYNFWQCIIRYKNNIIFYRSSKNKHKLAQLRNDFIIENKLPHKLNKIK